MFCRVANLGNPEALIKLGLAHLYNEGSKWLSVLLCISPKVFVLGFYPCLSSRFNGWGLEIRTQSCVYVSYSLDWQEWEDNTLLFHSSLPLSVSSRKALPPKRCVTAQKNGSSGWQFQWSFATGISNPEFVKLNVQFQKTERKARWMQRKMVVWLQSSFTKLNVPFPMQHLSPGFLFVLHGRLLGCAANHVSSTVWWSFVQMLK